MKNFASVYMGTVAGSQHAAVGPPPLRVTAASFAPAWNRLRAYANEAAECAVRPVYGTRAGAEAGPGPPTEARDTRTDPPS